METRKRILIVDDEEDICNILSFNLEKAGYDTRKVHSAEEALTSGVNGYDLILLDIMMEGISGLKMAEMMKKKGRTLIGWDEIIQRGKVNEQVVALSWHNPNDTLVATKTGHKAILTPASHMYLDFPEKSIPGEIQAATDRKSVV